MKEKIIKFITPDYKELFNLKDGGEIKITLYDGEVVIRKCTFLDETHMRVEGPGGGYVYHICEFAEKMQYAGNKVEKVEASK